MQATRSNIQRSEEEEAIMDLVMDDPAALLAEDPVQLTARDLARIGITGLPEPLAKGLLKYLPDDFLVEEIADGSYVSIDADDELVQSGNSESGTFQFQVVKRGLETTEVAEMIADQLGIPLESIGFAGMKDEQAITAQRMTATGVSSAQLRTVTGKGFFIKSIAPAEGTLRPGLLQGNHFTILIRSLPVDNFLLQNRLQKLAVAGFLNFYSVQRFGNRQNNHLVGRLILQQNYAEAAREVLIGDSPHERFFMREVRREAAKKWGNWRAMEESFLKFPQLFHIELRALKAMQDGPELSRIFAIQPENTRFFINAYMSYCFNRLLSRLSPEDPLLTADLPLLRRDPKVYPLYQNVMPNNELESLRFFHPQLSFLKFYRSIMVPPIVVPKIYGTAETAAGSAFCFDLPKGAYATTFFSNIYSLYQTQFEPEWLSSNFIDTPPLFGRQGEEFSPLRNFQFQAV